MDSPITLRDALVRAAREFPTRGVTIVHSRRREVARTFPQLLESILLGAGRLAALGIARGDRVVVSLATSWEWFEYYFGAMWLGALPVALAAGASSADLRRLQQLLEKLEAPRVVATSALAVAAERAGDRRVRDAILTTEALAAAAPASVPCDQEIDPRAVAFLQLTSGSTAAPRAVMISHESAIHNVRAIDEANGAAVGAPARTWIDGWVSWLPLHHDMGLVGCVLNALVSGFDLCLLSPRRFVGDPLQWLERLSRRGVVLATAPNYGYQLCVDRRERMATAGLDLSNWRAAMIGAEMIQPDTVERFCREFQPFGFNAQALCACYGLAEATLAVCYDQRGEGLRTYEAPRSSDAGASQRRVACVGAPVMDTEIRITAADGNTLAEGREGEILVRGPGVFLGYYNDPEATQEALRDGWLRTGDLGFVVDGELYISGRSKDLLIIRGHNLAPHELEWLATSTTGEGGAYRCGAFSVARGSRGEEAVVVLETAITESGALDQAEREIRLRVAHDLMLPLSDLVFVRRGRIPKTTSGKVQRRELRRLYLAGELGRLELS